MIERIQAAEMSQVRIPPIHHHMLRNISFHCCNDWMKSAAAACGRTSAIRGYV
jgi:hypothetical protein